MNDKREPSPASLAIDARRRVNARISVVVPVLNEQRNVDILANKLTAVLDEAGLDWSVIFVDDGSIDATLAHVRALCVADGRFGAVSFSRNFGKEASISAGLRRANGDAVIIMDADLQHPPEVLPKFIEAWRAGYSVVFGTREGRVGESALRRGVSNAYYWLFRYLSDTPIPKGVTDFILLDRKAIDALNALGERSRFTKGLYAWIGFPSTSVSFPVGERAGDRSRFNLIKLGRLAVDGVTSFSSWPLKIWSYLGVGISAFALLYAIVFLAQTLLFGVDVPGFPSLIVSIMFLSGVQLISLGVIGEYLARVFNEVKARPLFVVAEEIGRLRTDASQPAGDRPPVDHDNE